MYSTDIIAIWMNAASRAPRIKSSRSDPNLLPQVYSSRKIVLLTTYGVFCFIATTPVTMLDFLSQLNIDLSKLNSFHDFEKAYHSASQHQLMNAYITGLAALLANYGVYFLYLAPSFKSFLDVFKRLLGVRKEKVTVYDYLAIIWGLTTAISYAEISRETFSFLGVELSYLPFGLSLLTHYATRYAGIVAELKKYFDAEKRKRKKLATELSQLDKSDARIVEIDKENILVNQRLSNAVAEYLSQFNHSFLEEAVSNPRLSYRLEYCSLQSSLVMLAGIVTLFSILPFAAQKFVKGTESLLSINWGKESNYQGPDVLLAGYFFALPTGFFYRKASNNYVMEIRKMLIRFPELYSEGKWMTLVCWALLSSLIAYIGYRTGFGVKFLIEALIKSGYLKYLGLENPSSVYSTIFSNTAFLFTALMNASGLQKMLNNFMYYSKEYINFIDSDMVLHLLDSDDFNMDIDSII